MSPIKQETLIDPQTKLHVYILTKNIYGRLHLRKIVKYGSKEILNIIPIILWYRICFGEFYRNDTK